MTTKIEITKWVIANLEEHDNCALPNHLTYVDRNWLITTLSRKVGAKIRVRECEFTHNDPHTITKTHKVSTYLVAEVVKE